MPDRFNRDTARVLPQVSVKRRPGRDENEHKRPKKKKTYTLIAVFRRTNFGYLLPEVVRRKKNRKNKCHPVPPRADHGESGGIKIDKKKKPKKIRKTTIAKKPYEKYTVPACRVNNAVPSFPHIGREQIAGRLFSRGNKNGMTRSHVVSAHLFFFFFLQTSTV